MTQFESIICDALRCIGKGDKDGELAYLAFTSKPELPVRDRLAWEIHKRLKCEGLIVAREWTQKKKGKRVDIAVLDGDKPRIFIQLKTYSMFNFIKEGKAKKIFREVREDVVRKCRSVDDKAKAYALLLATCIDRKPDDSCRNAVKYWRGWRRAFEPSKKNHRVAATIQAEADEQIADQLKNWRRIVADTIPAGKAFKMQASIQYWLFQPK